MLKYFRAAIALAVGGLAGSAPLAAQQIDPDKYPTGLVDDSAAALTTLPQTQLTRAYIPDAIDLSASFPPPAHQKHSSCTAWATGYAARSYYARAEGGSVASDANIPSPAFIFNRIYRPVAGKACKDTGSSISDAMNLLQSVGSLSLQEYGKDETCKLDNPVLQSVPGKFRIVGHEIIGGRFTNIPLNIDIMRQQLSQGHPIVVGIRVDAALVALRPDEVYRGTSGLSLEQLAKMDGHALVVVGYDDRRRAFRALNSWGQTWADGGFGWLGYEAMQSHVTAAHIMKTATPPPRPTSARPPMIAAMSPLLADALKDEPCALVEESAYADEVTATGAKTKQQFTGFVPHARQKAVFDRWQREGTARSFVELRPWPLCEASLYLLEPLRAPSRPQVTTLSGKTALRVGESLGLKIVSPDIPAFLYALYLEDDGTVVNLLPKRGVMRTMTPANTEIVLGDGQAGRPKFTASALKAADERVPEERGHEAVIVLAARAPISELDDLETENSPLYRSPSKSAPGTGGPPERILLAKLKDLASRRERNLTSSREGDTLLQREVSAALLHLTISE